MKTIAALLLAALVTQAPPGSVQNLYQFEVYHGADGGYSEEQARVYVLADGGGVTYWPQFYPGDVVVSAKFVASVCASAQICTVPDGGVDPVSIQTFPCACSTGASCSLSDGGVAPNGTTLSAGTFSGAGCQPKSCTALFLTLPDGGRDGTWPAVCPLQ